MAAFPNRRVFLIVLDSLGIGEAPDAVDFGDAGSNTFQSISRSPALRIDTLRELGFCNIDGMDAPRVNTPRAAVARMTERSKGKDTTIGHWEIAGVVSEKPLPTYPNGFPPEVIAAFERATGRGTLCNCPYSGTQVIADYGEEHLRTGKLIVYTSADSVFQVAAHEDVVPPEELYRYCTQARELLQGEHGVGRVIARPFTGKHPFQRTSRRRDFSLLPPQPTMLDLLSDAGFDVISVGKISDIFASRGVTRSYLTAGNMDGMERTKTLQETDFRGLCFVNLVDFDMLYGHRNDVDGYAAALAEFDRWLPSFLRDMRQEDVLLITADHGCDPATPSTDHSREYTPLLVVGDAIRPVNLGTRGSFADIAATVCEWFDVSPPSAGISFAKEVKQRKREKQLMQPQKLIALAKEARQNAYAPYSEFQVGAALLTKEGTVYQGCNIENAAYTPTNCAERTAFFNAVSRGERQFAAIAIVGGKDGDVSEYCPPCGVCRQVMQEFCASDFKIYLGREDGQYQELTLAELLPRGFGPDNVRG